MTNKFGTIDPQLIKDTLVTETPEVIPDEVKEKCEACNGTGTYWTTSPDGYANDEPCEMCFGKGFTIKDGKE